MSIYVPKYIRVIIETWRFSFSVNTYSVSGCWMVWALSLSLAPSIPFLGILAIIFALFVLCSTQPFTTCISPLHDTHTHHRTIAGVTSCIRFIDFFGLCVVVTIVYGQGKLLYDFPTILWLMLHIFRFISFGRFLLRFLLGPGVLTCYFHLSGFGSPLVSSYTQKSSHSFPLLFAFLTREKPFIALFTCFRPKTH